MRRLTLALMLAAVPGCQRPARPSPPPAPASGPVEVTDGGVRIDAAAVEAFLRYQRQLAAPPPADRSGSAGGRLARLERLQRAADWEAAVRADAGLSEPTLEALEGLVAEVLTPREVARTLRYDQTLARMEELRASLPPERRPGVEKAIDALQERAAGLQSLDKAKQKFGASAVEAVLAREAELAQAWQASGDASAQRR